MPITRWKLLLCICALSLLHGRLGQAEPFRFDATLRVDLYHVGNARSERYLIDELRTEGPWPGSQHNLVDESGLGCAMAEIFAAELPRPAKPLFRQGYCTLFGEWQTTNEAKAVQRAFSETIRLPLPTQKLRLEIKSRDRRGHLVKIFETILDPEALEISREHKQGGLLVHQLHYSGAPAKNLDLIILGDGYERWQMTKYLQDAQRFTELLLKTEPFAHLRSHINIWAVESPSRQSGVDEPRKKIFRDTALSLSFNTFGSARYLMTTDNKAVRDVAANAPYDAILIMSNTNRYGGGGIFNLYASFIADNDYDEYVFLHEFGHSLAGLGDEYYTSQVAYNDMYPKGIEPWEPNLTAQTQLSKIKWKNLIAPDTPLPTPETDKRFSQKVGLFEGAGYSAKGLYRPAQNCKMFDKGHLPFCPVCSAAIADRILQHIR